MSSPVPQPWENPVRQRLRAGAPVFGLTITVNSIEVAAHAASLGFDFLWVEMEHSPVTLETLRSIVLATRASRAAVFARVPVNELWTAKRVLDVGVHGVIFPFSSTPELARQAADACRYPPVGRRGSGSFLAGLSWPEQQEPYPDSADRNVVVVAIIEEARAIERIDEIAATPEVDVLFIGTSDLAFSLGLRGNQNHPVAQEAIAKVAAAAQKHGKFLGRPAFTADRIREHLDQGFRFFQASSDLRLLDAGAKHLLSGFGR